MGSIVRAATIAVVCATAIATSPLSAEGASNATLGSTLLNIKTLQPVAGVEVRAYSEHGGTVLGRAVSDAAGVFEIGGLYGGSYRLEFKKTGYKETVLVAVWVAPHSRTTLSHGIAMYPSDVALPRSTLAGNPCGALVQPNQVADVYYMCNYSR